MKKRNILYVALIGAVTTLFSCHSGNSQPNYQQVPTVQVQQPQYQQLVQQPTEPQYQQTQVQANQPGGFDAIACANLMKQTKDPDALTTAINDPSRNINHLDLDGDGAVDYLCVEQTSPTQLSVIDRTSPTNNVTVCNFTFGSNSYVVNGVPEYCGSNYYRVYSGLTPSDYLFLTWWASPYHRSHYYRPYYTRYHSYPRGYSVYRPRTGLYNTASVNSYRTRTATTTTTRTIAKPVQQQQVRQQQSIAPKPVANVTAPIQSQKAFNANEGNRFKQTSSGNVFNKPVAPRATPSAVAPRPTPRPSGGFGGSSNRGGGSRGGRR